jgi:hypothetical protein
MRVDLNSATAAAVLNDAGQGATQANQAQRKAASANTDPADVASPLQTQAQPANQNQPAQNQAANQPKPAEVTVNVPPAIPAPEVMSVSFDQNRNTIYRFVDEKSGDLVRQVPPEEVLRVMRSVEDMLQESEQKLKVTL